MSIAFSLIPDNLRTPGSYAEFDNSLAVQGLPGQEHRVLLIGQRRTTGSKAELELVELFSLAGDDAKTYFGEGSLLHQMARRARVASRSVRIFAMALDDDAGGTAAIKSLTFTGPATASGTLALYVAGTRITVAVAAGATATSIAAGAQTAIAAVTSLPGTAAVDGGDDTKVNFTAHHKGETGNDIDIRHSYNAGEALPAGVGLTIATDTPGAGNPDVAPLIAALGDEWFNEFAMPYTDATNMTALEAELEDRWGPLRSIEGHAIACVQDTVANLTTFGNGRNSEHVTALGFYDSPTPAYEIAAALAPIIAENAQRAPARPMTGLTLPGVLAPPSASRFTQLERNTILYDGIATLDIGPGNAVQIDRLITMYQLNEASSPDESYLDLNTMLTLGYLRYSLRARLSLRFRRSSLAQDGTRFGPGLFVVTPSSAKAEVVSLFDEWEGAGLVEDVDQFLSDLVVEIDAGDPVRLNVLLPPNLVNPLLITAIRIQFRR
jgi:phage tail sheath gpL-like